MSQHTSVTIYGGTPLQGEWSVQPSKNAALPIIVASLLTPEPVTLHGVPQLSDVYTLLRIMSGLGTRFAWTGPHSLTMHTPTLTSIETPHELVAKLRASITLLGALLSRSREAKVGLPGGCTFSLRPVDQHLKSLRAIGADVREEGGVFLASRPKTLTGSYLFEMPTVGGTQNAILAAVLGEGEVTLENASADTDVVDMVNFLNSLGADITGAGTPTIIVRGVSALRGGEYRVIPDRLDAGTWMIAATATRGHVTLSGVRAKHLRAVSAKLREIGADVIEHDETTLTVDARQRLLRPVSVTATEYPGFPTDLQPIMGALLATVPGTSVLTDRIYARTTHVAELIRMGANIEVPGQTMIVQGGKLHGAHVTAADIRSGAALVVAGLAAEGETIIEGVAYLQRGYEDLLPKMRRLGARVDFTNVALPAAMD
ncbi:UDP-N-acetylglucosamine 1-carboxyvinyltransferase [Deinococcus yavapaiensis]|uniref:UDP-N-acetylglucosamine 1-carboxyvinyltransferase n=1 Tax=Deinococcus yavapaiensis KR-236 TaxID=694435 RepID=A0A318RZ88_9DEIO|nr:UDP-N-acetylglucosamine 1-carboxyvinyltransferase [Deinococcus yavapaiensis]PYE49013.1 UDP-N-acetylglucosamine 1-carboxyvinyltransferase [Deinococcus yavapaiensis KR-236]